MKLRLIMRIGTTAYDGTFVGYRHLTRLVDIPEDFDTKQEPEIIGGEWFDEAKELAGMIAKARKMKNISGT
jgi:hypothetical protein